MNRVFPLIEPLEDRQFLSAALGSTVNIGDVGTYIGTAKIRTSLDGAIRKTGITLTIKTHNNNDHITGTLAVGKNLTFNINGSVHEQGHTLSFGISLDKVGSGIYSGKIRKHLHVAEGYLTLKFTKFSTAAILDLIPSASQTGTGTGTGTGTTGGTGTAATPPPSSLTFPGTTTGSTSTEGTATGGSIFG